MAEAELRRTRRLLEVAEVMMSDPGARHYGYEVMKAIGCESSGLYPLLGKMERRGWITRVWEDNPNTGRPPRRYYVVTDLGQEKMADLLGDW